MITAGFTLHPDGITCHGCGRRSYSLRDRTERYCGACADFHGCQVCEAARAAVEVYCLPADLGILFAMMAKHRDPAAPHDRFHSWPGCWCCRPCAERVQAAWQDQPAWLPGEALAMTSRRYAQLCREIGRAVRDPRGGGDG